jgi:hypothetical protein
MAWVGDEPPAMERLTATGPVLVHFLDFAQLNSVRSLPYLLVWAERYREHGLRAFGVHSPRFPFTRGPEAVAGGMERLGVAHPVAVDSEHALWRDYGCRGWPSVFLWAKGGPLAWYHLGEGDYSETELAIREAIDPGRAPDRWPPTLDPVRATDEPGAPVVAPSPEVFPGGGAERPWAPGPADERALELEYAAGGASASVDGAGTILVALDGGEPVELGVSAPGLVELAAHERHGEHRLRLEPSDGVAVYSVSFAPGIP